MFINPTLTWSRVALQTGNKAFQLLERYGDVFFFVIVLGGKISCRSIPYLSAISNILGEWISGSADSSTVSSSVLAWWCWVKIAAILLSSYVSSCVLGSKIAEIRVLPPVFLEYLWKLMRDLDKLFIFFFFVYSCFDWEIECVPVEILPEGRNLCLCSSCFYVGSLQTWCTLTGPSFLL